MICNQTKPRWLKVDYCKIVTKQKQQQLTTVQQNIFSSRYTSITTSYLHINNTDISS